MIYRFADLELDIGRRQLSRAGKPISLTKLNYKVLRALVENAPNMVKHDELIDLAWGKNRVISPENLLQRVKILRKSLGDDVQNPVYIEGVRGHGFRLIPPVESVAAEAANSTLSGKLARAWQPAVLAILVVFVIGLLWPGLGKDQERQLTGNGAGNSVSEAIPPIDLAIGPSIAVLPFVNMSSDADNEYIGDGISEEIINSLVRQTTLPIIARTSSFQFKGKQVGGKVIGEMLGATHLLEGSVRISGDRVRITAQLVDSPSGFHLWSEQYDRSIDDLFAIQSEIANTIVDEIKAQLAPAGEDRILEDIISPSNPLREKVKPEAYEAYLEGLKHRNRMLPDDISLALDYFAQAVELQPDFEEAWAARIDTQFLATWTVFIVATPAEAYDNIEEWMKTFSPEVLERPAMQAYAGAIKAFSHYRWKEGLHQIQQALPKLSNDPRMLTFIAVNYAWIGQIKYSVMLLEQAQVLDPYSTEIRGVLATLYGYLGRQQEAFAIMKEGDSEYIFNMIAAAEDFMLGRTAEMDHHLREAKKWVRADHPAILSMESLLLDQKGELEAAYAITNPLLDNMREVPVVLGMIAIPKERHKEIYAIAEEQRQLFMISWLIQGERNEVITPYYEKLNLDDLPDDKRGMEGLRTEEERQNLLNNELFVSSATLDNYVGTYISGGQQINISMVDDRLYIQRRYEEGPLSAVEVNRFVSMVENDLEVKFLPNSEGVYDLCIWTSGQFTWRGYKVNDSD